MRGFILYIARALALAGVMVVGITVGIAAAESRLGSEDLVFSYTRESDRVVFGGLGYVADSEEAMNHPDRSTLYVQDLKTGAKPRCLKQRANTWATLKCLPRERPLRCRSLRKKGFAMPGFSF